MKVYEDLVSDHPRIYISTSVIKIKYKKSFLIFIFTRLNIYLVSLPIFMCVYNIYVHIDIFLT